MNENRKDLSIINEDSNDRLTLSVGGRIFYFFDAPLRWGDHQTIIKDLKKLNYIERCIQMIDESKEEEFFKEVFEDEDDVYMAIDDRAFIIIDQLKETDLFEKLSKKFITTLANEEKVTKTTDESDNPNESITSVDSRFYINYLQKIIEEAEIDNPYSEFELRGKIFKTKQFRKEFDIVSVRKMRDKLIEDNNRLKYSTYIELSTYVAIWIFISYYLHAMQVLLNKKIPIFSPLFNYHFQKAEEKLENRKINDAQTSDITVADYLSSEKSIYSREMLFKWFNHYQYFDEQFFNNLSASGMITSDDLDDNQDDEFVLLSESNQMVLSKEMNQKKIIFLGSVLQVLLYNLTKSHENIYTNISVTAMVKDLIHELFQIQGIIGHHSLRWRIPTLQKTDDETDDDFFAEIAERITRTLMTSSFSPRFLDHQIFSEMILFVEEVDFDSLFIMKERIKKEGSVLFDFTKILLSCIKESFTEVFSYESVSYFLLWIETVNETTQLPPQYARFYNQFKNNIERLIKMNNSEDGRRWLKHKEQKETVFQVNDILFREESIDIVVSYGDKKITMPARELTTESQTFLFHQLFDYPPYFSIFDFFKLHYDRVLEN